MQRVKKGIITNVNRFCTEDGPGIRTTVFLKGCYLKCKWCHNPETQNFKPEISYDKHKCVNCGACEIVCPTNCHKKHDYHIFSRANCTSCAKCAKVCPTQALTVYGKKVSASDVLKEIKKDMDYYGSEGGVTISGGEPLAQPDFCKEILKACRKIGIHTAIETSGYSNPETFLSVIKYCNLVLFDVKETNPKNHLDYTGVSLEPILKNLNTLDEQNIPFIIRAPIIPTLNDREEHFEGLKKLRNSLTNCLGLEILPYHEIGVYKYETLNREYLCHGVKTPDDKTVDKWRDLVK